MTKALIRPAWTPVTIAMMIIGFMIFWPLGLAMIAYIVWGDRLDEIKVEINRATDRFSGGCSRRARHPRHRGPWREAPTGNMAFDEWREAEIERLAEERRKLEEMRKEFEEFSDELRRAKDQNEFESFMADRDAKVTKDEKKSTRKSGGKKISK